MVYADGWLLNVLPDRASLMSSRTQECLCGHSRAPRWTSDYLSRDRILSRGATALRVPAPVSMATRVSACVPVVVTM